MKIGVVFPQTEIGGDPGAVRAYGQRVEELGFTHILAYDHVLGADPAVHQRLERALRHATRLSTSRWCCSATWPAITSLELVTGIIILPQRQTALVAKQAAEVDLLTGGRFRLGVGLGWNAVEYEALGKDFTNRGRRIERAGRAAAAAVDRASRSLRAANTSASPAPGLARCRCSGRSRSGSAASRGRAYAGSAGWPTAGSRRCRRDQKLDEARAIVDAAAVAAGRDPAAIGMEGRVSWTAGGAEKLVDHVGRWRAAGATHVSINTMGAGLGSVDGHLTALTAAAEALGLPA